MPPPFAFPPDSEKCCSSKIALISVNYSDSMLEDLKKIFSSVKHFQTVSSHFAMEVKQGSAHLWEKDEVFLLASISGMAALSVELPPEPHWTMTQGGPRWDVCEFDPVPEWWIVVFAFFVTHQHFYSAVNLPWPECNFSLRCWIVFEWFFFFMHLCIFALEEPLILYMENRHLDCRFASRYV